MSTASHTAASVMDRSAALLNDAAHTDYTYPVLTQYLNMAIEELNQLAEEANLPITNAISTIYPIRIAENEVRNIPDDIVEIQEVGEREKGAVTDFRRLTRKEFTNIYPATNSLLFWCWQDQKIRFNPSGATVYLEIQLKYIRTGLELVRDPEQILGSIHSISFLSYKTAALAAMFVGEDKERAGVLDNMAEEAVERIYAISNKGRQQIMTRHRPFRASYKMRGF